MINWKQIKDFPDYEVSDQGKVRNKRTGRTSHGYINGWGYLSVTLYRSGKKYCRMMHNLVVDAFIGGRLDKMVSNHKNGIKTDNRVVNLEVCTVSENNKHAYRMGLKKPTRLYGPDNGMYKSRRLHG